MYKLRVLTCWKSVFEIGIPIGQRFIQFWYTLVYTWQGLFALVRSTSSGPLETFKWHKRNDASSVYRKKQRLEQVFWGELHWIAPKQICWFARSISKSSSATTTKVTVSMPSGNTIRWIKWEHIFYLLWVGGCRDQQQPHIHTNDNCLQWCNERIYGYKEFHFKKSNNLNQSG